MVVWDFRHQQYVSIFVVVFNFVWSVNGEQVEIVEAEAPFEEVIFSTDLSRVNKKRET